jgi:ABC-2 type transport system permease protein
MSTVSYAMADSITMLRRDLRHLLRYPIMIIAYLGQPVFFLLMLVGVFGHTLGAGLGSASGYTRYADYVSPAIILITVNFGCTTTALNVSNDMTQGLMDRFRTMAIWRSSILVGHVLEAMIRTMVSMAVVAALALALGFRPTAGIVGWLALIGLTGLFTFALTWLVVAFCLATKSLEGANSLTLPLQFLPFLSSAFVAAASMPAGISWFANNQPLTPIINTLRGLLVSKPIGNDGLIAVAWCVGIALIGYIWSKRSFSRQSSTPPSAAAR